VENAIDAEERALVAMKTDKEDRMVRLRVVRRAGQLLEPAQGERQAVEESDKVFTWPEFLELYRRRNGAPAGSDTQQ